FDLAVTGCLIVGAFAALTVGIGHIRPDFKELKDWFEQAVSNGWEIEPWIPARLTNLESQMWTMQLLRAMALGLALLAPLGLFLSWNAKRRATWFDWVLPSGMGLLTVALLFVFYGQSWEFETVRDFIRNVSQDRLDFSATYVSKFLVYGLPALLCYLFVERPLRFGLAFGAFLLASTLYDMRTERPLHQERSYFGVLKIQTHKKGDSEFHILTHGTTTHGMQCMDPQRRSEPMTYYHRNGPVGQLFGAYPELAHNYAVIGLGTGTMAAYGGPENRLTFYEIDRHVKQIADNTEYFTYLTDYKSRRGDGRDPIVLGDARLQLEKAQDKYGIIVVDAFSSDAIPVHLITVEALRMYFEKLSDNGIIAFHISNRWLDLIPVLHHLAEATETAALIDHDYGDGVRGWDSEWYQSSWVVVARRPEDLQRLVHQHWYSWSGRPALLALGAWPGPSLAGIAATVAGAQERTFWEPLEPRDFADVEAWKKVGV